MNTTLLLIAALTVPVDTGKAPYDVALEYCSSHGGLAQYVVSGSTITFSCANSLETVLTITR